MHTATGQRHCQIIRILSIPNLVLFFDGTTTARYLSTCLLLNLKWHKEHSTALSNPVFLFRPSVGI